MADEDYDLFLRAVRRKSEDRELAELILSLPADEDDTETVFETDCNNTAPSETIPVESFPATLPIPAESSAPDSPSNNHIPIRPHRIFIPLKDDSHSNISGSVTTPPTLHSSSSADSMDGKVFISSPRVVIDPHNTHWMDEFLANFNQVWFVSSILLLVLTLVRSTVGSHESLLPMISSFYRIRKTELACLIAKTKEANRSFSGACRT